MIPNFVATFASRLEQLEIPYVITGSVAAMIYGEARLTMDVDVIVELKFAAATLLPRAFPPPEFYCPPTEVITVEIARDLRGHFNIIHMESVFKADVYLRGRDPFHAWALSKAKRVNIGGAEVNVAPVEYVIIRKLEYFREGASEKHLRDIRTMVENPKTKIDYPELEKLIEDRALANEWAKVRTIGM
jgi:hypothetical protein